jgi:hypothetical protein
LNRRGYKNILQGSIFLHADDSGSHSMTIHASCPACGAAYELDEAMEGKYVVCRECQDSFRAENDPNLDPDAEDQREREGERRQRRRREQEDKRRRKEDRDRAEEEKYGDGTVVGGVLIGIGALLLIAFLGCGGLVWYVTNSVSKKVDRFVNDVGNVPMPPPPAFEQPQPNPKVNPKPVADIADALARLRSVDAAERLAGVRWLAQAPLDPARRDQVLKALRTLQKDVDVIVQNEVVRALAKWGE